MNIKSALEGVRTRAGSAVEAMGEKVPYEVDFRPGTGRTLLAGVASVVVGTLIRSAVVRRKRRTREER